MTERPLRKELSKKNLSSKGVPNHFFDTTIDDFETYDNDTLTKAKRIITEYLDNLPVHRRNGDGLYLCGSNGVGKTMLSSIIVKEAYRHRYSSKRITFVEYIDQYTKIWKAKTVEEKEELEDQFYSYIKAVDFLVLEEVGKESTPRDMAVTILEDCLRYREEHGLCTIIVANLYLKDLIGQKYQSASVESLIRGHTKLVKIIGIDRRVNKQ